jgi:ubiquinone/menaquinone biosynthesis C-methylase UbiE
MDDGRLKDELIATWDAEAAAYDTAPRHGILHDDEWMAWRRLVAAVLGDPKHSDVRPLRVLDVGTGTGLLALIAAELGHEVTGVDMSDTMLSEARRKGAVAGLSIDWRVADAESLPADIGGFDAIVCRHLVWTLPHPDRALASWRTAARPGGLVAIVDGWYASRPLPVALLARAARAYRAWRRGRTGHRDHDYPAEAYARLPLGRQRDTLGVTRLLEAAGLERVRVRPLTEIDRVERRHLGPLGSLSDPWHRYLATGRTPILVAERH